jgi:MYXO-CTERM domain-containing protein
MRNISIFVVAAALAAAPAAAQDMNNTATAMPDANATAPATDVNMTNDVVLAPGEGTAVAPMEPITTEPLGTAPVERDDDRGFPWGLLGLLGLAGLLGRARRSRADT